MPLKKICLLVSVIVYFFTRDKYFSNLYVFNISLSPLYDWPFLFPPSGNSFVSWFSPLFFRRRRRKEEEEKKARNFSHARLNATERPSIDLFGSIFECICVRRGLPRPLPPPTLWFLSSLVPPPTHCEYFLVMSPTRAWAWIGRSLSPCFSLYESKGSSSQPHRPQAQDSKKRWDINRVFPPIEFEVWN